MFKRIKASGDPRWKLVHFSSHDNPHISSEALDELSNDMTALAYRMEIMAEDVDEAPGALWTRHTIESNRVYRIPDQTERIIIGVDPRKPVPAMRCRHCRSGIECWAWLYPWR